MAMATLLWLAALAAPASAAVRYEFVGNDYSEFNDSIPVFSFILPDFASATMVTGIPLAALANCSVSDALLPTTCGAVELRPNFAGQGNDVLIFNSANQYGSGQSAYTFDLGAFSNAGTYTDAITQGAGQLVKATLTVSTVASPGAVPEPATWAMLVLGFGAIGGALRHGRRRGRIAHA